ncbi:hypothetical protein CISIN_1g0450922mg, partial [Citrus sinensis]
HWSLHINCCGKQVIADGNTTFEDDSDAAGASKLAPLSRKTYISWLHSESACEEILFLKINPVISSIELKGLDLPTGSFHLRQIKAATNNFASENEISERGFGPVYRGLLADGKVIEVKQLSSKSKQGNREIVNEIGMISALQHPNLVKLYRLCTETLKQPIVYMAPEYAKHGYLTDKAEVCSFGIVTLEIESGRSNVICRTKEDKFYLLDWLGSYLKRARKLNGASCSKFGFKFYRRTSDGNDQCSSSVTPTNRPLMSFVVSMLE